MVYVGSLEAYKLQTSKERKKHNTIESWFHLLAVFH